MSIGPRVDIDRLHRYLWRKADSRGMLRLYQKQFAEELGVTESSMSHIFRRMEEQGRLRRGTRRATNKVRTLIINDPDTWEPPT